MTSTKTHFNRTNSAVFLAVSLALGACGGNAGSEGAGATSLQGQAVVAAAPDGLSAPAKKDIAMQLVSSAENSSLNWKAQYSYIEDIGDGRGYTGGIIGFTSGTSDMLALVEAYNKTKPNNVLSKYLPALRKVNGSASHAGLDPNFVPDWKTAAKDVVFQQSQDTLRDNQYFNPSVTLAKQDGLRTLGQFIYYDAIVMHGPGSDNQRSSLQGIRAEALRRATPPSKGGNETTYLNAFLDVRRALMLSEADHGGNVDRIDTEQRVFLRNGNLDLNTPLNWSVYGDQYQIR
ncbi:chitosanase [Janthinobacterium agaricidamnosum]|uniref:Chitosanase n=1 Tax=Janthinobacterium agaricidamnosum NBRC 102515 = DSM 9628 TaxID=1349767 RepID=W0V3B7_9BURK|nr:chitosanase [Janthinobacterium agaricidamnosum]CDG81767.1 chitosanase [Janthinobacterium agaricidamnosum NBRC 102515 = DSM 9628]